MSGIEDMLAAFFDACAAGDIEAMRRLLDSEPGLARATNPRTQHGGWTGLHAAAQSGRLDAVRLLLERGADPNAREEGDHTYPLHWAAAQWHVDIAGALLDAGGDVHGVGDLHELDVIGWATLFHPDDRPHETPPPELLSLLIARGARHHIISAIALGDLDLIRAVVADNREALERRMSRFEQEQTPLHLAISRKRYDVLDLLIELGANLEAGDRDGQTALEVAMLRGDRDAMRRLHAAGAKIPPLNAPSHVTAGMAALAGSVKKGVPMIHVPDVGTTLDWYVSIGFTELAKYGENGIASFAMVAFGKAQLMLVPNGASGEHGASLWFYTDQIDALYQLLKSRQLGAAYAVLTGEPGEHRGIEFIEELYEPFYGGREFGIRDVNGYSLFFMQE